MADDWIKWVKGLEKKPEVVAMSFALGRDPYEIAGRLMVLWSWCDENIQDTQIDALDWATVRMSPRHGDNCNWIDRLVGLSGFAEQMCTVGWLKVRNADICFPHYGRHNSSSAKTRARNARNQKRKRSESKGLEKAVTEMSPANGDSSSLLFSLSSDVSSRSEETTGGGSGGRCAPSQDAKRARKVRSKAVISVEELEIATELDTQEVREALQLWLDYKRERGEEYKQAAYLTRHLRKFVAGGPEHLVDAIDQAMGSMHQGFFPPSGGRSAQKITDPRGTFAAREAYLRTERELAIDAEFEQQNRAG